MKKVLFIIFFIFVLFLNKNNDKVTTTFIEYDTLYNKYNLDISSCNITTKNINQINKFNIKIIALFPHIDKYYINILGNDLNYFYINNINNLTLFNNYYNSLLKKLGLNNYKNYVNINGIKIDKVIIYSKNSDLNNLKREYSCIKQ